ncbi:MAG: protein-L-isoaspartate(D-aspartate) O-methyltransferase [Planctomycetota bacterium]
MRGRVLSMRPTLWLAHATREVDVSLTFDQAAERMVRTQLRTRGIRDSRVLDAMRRVERHHFALPDVSPAEAYGDHPLSIDQGQSLSQPFVVAHMTTLLDVQPGQRVLEIGTGSGYQTAVLAALGAVVVSVERHALLSDAAKARLEHHCPEAPVTLVVGDGSLGWPDLAPYDRILVAAAAPRLPIALDQQLKPDGRMVIPLGDRNEQVLAIFIRQGDALLRQNDLPCRFVPMIGRDALPG